MAPSQPPFSQRVTDPTWRSAATGWIEDQVRRAGRALTGPIEQIRVRPWSTQLIAPTDAGRWWFKAGCGSMAFEPALHAALAEIAPSTVSPLVAVDADRGWMLTADQGRTLLDEHDPTVQDWRRVVRTIAEAQRLVAGHRDRLLATGLPNCAPHTTVDRFDRLLAVYADLPDQHPAHVSAELTGRLRAARPRLVDAAARLEGSRIPATWQHGDLHPGNAFVRETQTRLFDFGDSQWAHALETLMVPFGVVTDLSDLPWAPILGEFAEVWGVEVSDLEHDWPDVALTHAVNRSLTWWRCLSEATAQDWQEWGEAPRVHLLEVLDS
ncbi:phosphotransferase family protein [Aeromicrobium sp. CF3.5]|uniref:phosphotransferase family protein n=1 Tax=Aeromicrobium sp. CF3.5 TaxID=3373078 RepID=UPI003EE7552E